MFFREGGSIEFLTETGVRYGRYTFEGEGKVSIGEESSEGIRYLGIFQFSEDGSEATGEMGDSFYLPSSYVERFVYQGPVKKVTIDKQADDNDQTVYDCWRKFGVGFPSD